MALASLKNGERSLTVNKKTLATNLQSTSRTAVIPYKAMSAGKGPITHNDLLGPDYGLLLHESVVNEPYCLG